MFSAGGSSVTAVDLPRLLAEIDEEVRSRRASGDFPPGMERELDLLFARFAPATVSADDLDGLLQSAERSSFINPDPPTESRIPAVSFLKRVERKLLGWFFRFLAQQVTAFGASVVRALRLLGRRVEALEAATPGANEALLELARSVARPASAGSAVDAVVGHVAGSGGRILVAEAGDGAVLEALRAAGADAYGVEPRADRAESLVLAGADVRRDDARSHLAAVADGALGGLVLAGVVDRAALGVKLALVARAAEVLPPGGRLALIGSDPATWGTDDPIEADLAPGRPLHAETWSHLLGEHGFTQIGAVAADGRTVLTAVR